MKRWKGILLLCCLIVPFAGTWQFHALQLHWARQDVNAKISKGIIEEEQVLLYFTDKQATTQLLWEHSREFEYKGEMYDIIRQERRGDTTWYWCHWDRKETKIRKDMQDVLAHAMGTPQQKKSQERIGDFFKTLFLHHGPRLRTQEIKAMYVMYAERDALNVLTHTPSPPFPPPEISL